MFRTNICSTRKDLSARNVCTLVQEPLLCGNPCNISAALSGANPPLSSGGGAAFPGALHGGVSDLLPHAALHPRLEITTQQVLYVQEVLSNFDYILTLYTVCAVYTLKNKVDPDPTNAPGSGFTTLIGTC